MTEEMRLVDQEDGLKEDLREVFTSVDYSEET